MNRILILLVALCVALGLSSCSQGKFGWVIDPEGNKIELWQPLEGYESIFKPCSHGREIAGKIVMLHATGR